MWIYNLVSIKVAISMLNFKVYWSILGTYFILVRASTCLVFWIESSKSFWKVSCGNSVSLVPKIKTTRFQVLIWGELVLYKTPFPGDSHQPDMLGLDAGFPAAPVRSLQWLDHPYILVCATRERTIKTTATNIKKIQIVIKNCHQKLS